MNNAYKTFIQQTCKLRVIAEDIYVWPNSSSNWQYKYLSYSLISQLWQHWCLFCRAIIFISCNGGITRSGIRIGNRSGDNSWQRIGYEAKEYSSGKTPHATRRLNYIRHEPTWGDQSVLLRVITGINPSNASNLLVGFGLSIHGPKHLQVVRNACAHTDSETMQQVRDISLYYIGLNLNHPVDVIWWLDSTTSTDAIFQWIDDLETVARIVTQ